jgi:hypothetical protein
MTAVYVTAWRIHIQGNVLGFEPFGDKLATLPVFDAKNIDEVEKAIESWLTEGPKNLKIDFARSAVSKYPEKAFVDFSIFQANTRGGRKFANFDKLTKELQRKLRFRADAYLATQQERVADAVSFLEEIGG